MARYQRRGCPDAYQYLRDRLCAEKSHRDKEQLDRIFGTEPLWIHPDMTPGQGAAGERQHVVDAPAILDAENIGLVAETAAGSPKRVQLRNAQGVTLQLTRLDQPVSTTPRRRRPMTALGLTHLNFYVRDYEATLRTVRVRGGAVAEDTQIASSDGTSSTSMITAQIPTASGSKSGRPHLMALEAFRPPSPASITNSRIQASASATCKNP